MVRGPSGALVGAEGAINRTKITGEESGGLYEAYRCLHKVVKPRLLGSQKNPGIVIPHDTFLIYDPARIRFQRSSEEWKITLTGDQLVPFELSRL